MALDKERKKKVEKCIETFRANFGRLDDQDGVKYWVDWLSNPGINVDRVTSLIETLAADWNGDKKPRIGKIKRMYNESVGLTPTKRVRKEGEVCDLCRDNGHVQAITGGTSADSLEYVNRPKNYRYLSFRLFPCRCQRGREFYQKQGEAFTSRFSFSQIETAHDRGYAFCSMNAVNDFFDKCHASEEVTI